MKRVKNIVKWVISVLMLLFVLAALTTKGGILSGIIFLIMAVAVNPLFTKFLESKDISIKGILYIPVMIVAFFVSLVFYPTTEKQPEETKSIKSFEQAENTQSISSENDTLLITRNTPVEQEQTEQEQVILEMEESTEQEDAEQERLAQEEDEHERLIQEKTEQERLAKEKAEQEKAAQSQGANDGGGNGENLNKYNNADQQKTDEKWVLNTNSKKIHYPSCSAVKKISSKNYSTSSLSLEELKAQNYTTCGICFK